MVQPIAAKGATERNPRIINDLSRWTHARLPAGAFGLALSIAAGTVQAHCDTLDGPVVAAARKALDSGNVGLVLVWVQKADEAEIRKAFQKTTAVRKAGSEARELADMYFFETLVRIHRMGGGAPYTGLKSGKVEPPVAAADRAIETGRIEGVAKLVTDRMHQGLEKHFREVMAKKKYNSADIAAGRPFSGAYVEYTHYVERLYDAAETLAPAAAGDKNKAAHPH